MKSAPVLAASGGHARTERAVNPPTCTCGPIATKGSSRANTPKGSSTASRGSRWRSGTRVLSSTPTATSSSTRRARRCWAGTDTTSSTKATSPTSLACAGIRCSAVVPSTCRCAEEPEPTSVLAPRRAAPQEQDEPGHDQADHGDAEQPGQPTGEAGVVHAGDGVAGQWRARRGGAARGAGEAERLGDVGQAVGVAGGVEGQHAGDQGADQQPQHDEAAGAHATGSGARSTRAGRRPRAPYTRSGRAATTLETARTVMTASPTPMTTCQPVMTAASWASGMGAAPPKAYSPTNARAATGTLTKAPTPAATLTLESRFGSSARAT